MANNLSNRTAYIIIGIDEENNYAVTNIINDQNRKNTQQLVDFLKDKKFAGGIRPIVRVEQILLYQGTVDVIIVENSHHTPFYLVESFEQIRANYIYTRIMDTNTPIDKSADIDKIEQLWQKHFYLDETPIEKVYNYLKSPQNWEESPIEYEYLYFHKQFPEFIVRSESDETRNGYEFYMFGQADYSPHWDLITLYYHQTALKQLLGVALDGGRWFVVAPRRFGFSFSGKIEWDISYMYYIENSIEYVLQQFYNYKQPSCYWSVYEQYLRCVLIFHSDEEKEQFDIYLKSRQEEYHRLFKENVYLPFFPDLNGYNMDHFKKEYRDALVLQKMLSDFKSRN